MNEITLGRLVDALEADDGTALREVFTENVSMRASLPRRDVALSGAAEVTDLMLGWFAGRTAISRLAYEVSSVGDVGRVSYRFAFSDPDGDFVVEQHAYVTFVADRIGSIRLLCSGSRPSGAFLEALGEGCATLTPRVATAMRGLASGQVLTVLTDDAAAPEGIAAWSRMTGHEIVTVSAEPRGTRFQLRHK